MAKKSPRTIRANVLKGNAQNIRPPMSGEPKKVQLAFLKEGLGVCIRQGNTEDWIVMNDASEQVVHFGWLAKKALGEKPIHITAGIKASVKDGKLMLWTEENTWPTGVDVKLKKLLAEDADKKEIAGQSAVMRYRKHIAAALIAALAGMGVVNLAHGAEGAEEAAIHSQE